MTEDPVRVDAAQHLILIARQLRANGDVALVEFTPDGIVPAKVTLAGELELIALQLDFDGCVARARQEQE